MLKRYPADNHGKADHGWLKSLFHFSFAEYDNPQRENFGILQVINDDIVAPGRGFDTHPHRDMEIISYVIDGELTHGDSLGNKSTISRGHVQYMSAGQGIRHSEHNLGKDTLRLLQIWISPDAKALTPSYGDYRFDWDLKVNKLLHMVSPIDGKAPVKIHADANIYSLELSKDERIEFPLFKGRQAYMVQIEGESMINDMNISEKDGLEAVEASLNIRAVTKSHFLIIEMAKSPVK